MLRFQMVFGNNLSKASWVSAFILLFLLLVAVCVGFVVCFGGCILLFEWSPPTHGTVLLQIRLRC